MTIDDSSIPELGVHGPDAAGLDAQVMLSEIQAQMFGPRDPTTVGRFTLSKRLGRGAFGSVYLAHDAQLQREVAVKFLSAGTAGPETRARFVREAQALAQLKHPNVLTVHDVGVEDDRVYIAMEYVEAGTLSDWAKTRPVGTRARFSDVLQLAIATARGLAAAHTAGLVHRDVKPANILVGADGRPRLADFGLVGASASERSSERETRSSDSLTRTGDVLGTPAYMAPEQFAGHGDAASDQWSLCATFWETAYGERPFVGKDATTLAVALQGRPRRPPSARTEVPTWWREILTRGLAPDPADRWPSVEALAVALQTAVGRRRRRAMTMGAAAVAVAGLGAVAWGRVDLEQRRQRCEHDAEAIDEVWGAETQAQLHRALADSDVSYAETTFRRAAPILDAYAEQWRDEFNRLCTATQVSGERSPEAWAASTRCLTERKAQVASLLEALIEGADADAASRTVSAVAGLPRIEPCHDDALLARVHSREPDAASGAIRERLRKAQALQAAGDLQAGRRLAEALTDDAADSPNARLRAQILLARGQIEDLAGEPGVAREHLGDAFDFALAAGEDDVAADAASRLLYVVGSHFSELDQALVWGRVAEGLHARLGARNELAMARLQSHLGDVYRVHDKLDESHAAFTRALQMQTGLLGTEHPDVAASYSGVGNVLFAQGKYVDAEQAQHKALAVLQSALGEDHPRVAGAYNSLGKAYGAQGRLEDAERAHVAALAIQRAAFPPDHPDIGTSLASLAYAYFAQGKHEQAEQTAKDAVAISDKALGAAHPRAAFPSKVLGRLYHAQGRYAEAEQAFSSALAVEEEALGPDHGEVGKTLSSLAVVYLPLGRYDDAERVLQRSIRILEGSLGPEHPDVAITLNTLGGVYGRSNRIAEAEKTYTRALTILESALGPDHAEVARTVNNLAAMALRGGREADAEALYTRAIAVQQAARGMEHPELANPLLGRAEVRVKLGRPADALPDAELATKILEAADVGPLQLAGARFDLALTLRAAEGDLQRVRGLATQALEAYRAGGELHVQDVGKIEAWLEQLPPDGR